MIVFKLIRSHMQVETGTKLARNNDSDVDDDFVDLGAVVLGRYAQRKLLEYHDREAAEYLTQFRLSVLCLLISCQSVKTFMLCLVSLVNKETQLQ